MIELFTKGIWLNGGVVTANFVIQASSFWALRFAGGFKLGIIKTMLIAHAEMVSIASLIYSVLTPTMHALLGIGAYYFPRIRLPPDR